MQTPVVRLNGLNQSTLRRLSAQPFELVHNKTWPEALKRKNTTPKVVKLLGCSIMMQMPSAALSWAKLKKEISTVSEKEEVSTADGSTWYQ